MPHLTLAGVSEDGARLLLVDDSGREFTLEVTSGLRSAIRGDVSRLGQLEMRMDSPLRPRDIQARIRAGESPEDVADAAQTNVDKIMVYARPVMAERQHVAGRAQRSSVRRASGDTPNPAHGRTLGEAVAHHLRTGNIDPDMVEWDAARREDGRWTLTAVFVTTAREGTALFTFDAPGNYVVMDNEDARWLIGESVVVPDAPRDDLQHARSRRLNAVPEGELPLGDDAIELVAEEPSALLDEPLPEPESPSSESDESEGPAEPADEPAAEQEPPKRPVSKKRGRASVPSWDEIMFGGGDR